MEVTSWPIKAYRQRLLKLKHQVEELTKARELGILSEGEASTLLNLWDAEADEIAEYVAVLIQLQNSCKN